MGLKIPTRSAADDGRLSILGGKVAVQGVHRPLARFDLVGVVLLQTEATPGPVVKQDSGIPGDESRAEGVGKAVDPGDAVAISVGHAEVSGVATGLHRFDGG